MDRLLSMLRRLIGHRNLTKEFHTISFWLPNDAYVRQKIVAGRSEQSKPWGELTYFGRPVVIKTGSGKRLVLNLAQPEASAATYQCRSAPCIGGRDCNSGSSRCWSASVLTSTACTCAGSNTAAYWYRPYQKPFTMTSASPWCHGTPERQWYGFGRYYAMFPPSFVVNAVSELTERGDMVLDPFCGRGNGPFTAAVLGTANRWH